MKAKINTDYLYFRKIRTGEGMFPFLRMGEIVEVLTKEEVARERIFYAQTNRIDDVWVEIRRENGDVGICSARYITEYRESGTLIGLHGYSDPWDWSDAQIQVVADSKVDAVKLLTPGHSSFTLNRIKSIPSVKFVMARLFSKFDQPKTPLQFVDEVKHGMKDLYDNGVRFFEVHNEPNLHIPHSNPEGMWVNWNNGYEFANWFTEVYYLLKELFPVASLGYPGLSPGNDIPSVRYNSSRFYDESRDAIELADWVGIHAYWNKNYSKLMAYDDIISLASYTFPSKMVMVTETSNADKDIPSDTKAEEYVWLTRQELPVDAIFFYTLDASSDPRKEAWLGTNIPSIMSRR